MPCRFTSEGGFHPGDQNNEELSPAALQVWAELERQWEERRQEVEQRQAALEGKLRRIQRMKRYMYPLCFLGSCCLTCLVWGILIISSESSERTGDIFYFVLFILVSAAMGGVSGVLADMPYKRSIVSLRRELQEFPELRESYEGFVKQYPLWRGLIDEVLR